MSETRGKCEPTTSASTTRSGRQVKAPVRYEPSETVEDDYASEDYDSQDESEVSSEISYDSDEEDSADDADVDGNLDGFVVGDETDSDKNDSDSEDSDGEPPIPVPVPVAVAKRGAPRRK